MLDLATVFIEQGHFVQVLGPASADTDVPDFVVKGGGSIPISYNGSVARLSIGPQVTRRVKDFIREGDFDVLHIHEPNSPSYSMRALSIAEGPIVATYHASAASSRLLQLVRPVLSPMLEKIRGGIAVSEMARRWQVEQLGGDPILIPNGVDFVGRVSDLDKARILGRADIYVAPNRGGESFGIVLVEAMAAGCAVVASDLEAFAAVCNVEAEQPAGLLFKNGDARDLAAKI